MSPRNDTTTDNLLAAARALLAARSDQMLTADEWEALERAVAEHAAMTQRSGVRDGPQAPQVPQSPGS